MKQLMRFAGLFAVIVLIASGCLEHQEPVLAPAVPDETTTGLTANKTKSGLSLAAVPNNETLGDIDIALAQGTGVVVGGVGLVGVADKPGTIDIDVPGEVKQVLAYWIGHNETEGGDGDIMVEGTLVEGTLVGGPVFFFDPAWTSTYRADITDLGVVAQGMNSVDVSGMNFTTLCPWECQNLGIGLLVIYDDGSVPAAIQIKEGADNAYYQFPSPRDVTTLQTFTFAASPDARVAKLSLFAGSASQFPNEGGRPNVVEVTVDGAITRYIDVLVGNTGNDFDAVTLDVDVPAGATTMTVQLFSERDPSSTFTGEPSSISWGAAGLTIPAAETPLASIGDFVWEDLNRNGRQDDGEPGVEGVTVELLDCNGNVLDTTTTGVNGEYLFTGLTPGNYNVRFVLPAGYEFTVMDAPAVDDALDSDAGPNGMTACTTLDAGEFDDTWDAGIFQPEPELASIGDFVWNDVDMDGIQDTDELGVEGVTVKLMDCFGNVLATTVTAQDGSYLFSGLTPGDYNIMFNLPAGYVFSPQDQGADDEVDSDADTGTGMTICTTLDPGENDLSWDAGIYEEMVDCGECEGKVTQLTLQYNGSVGANVVVEQKKDNIVIFDEFVNPGDQFTFVGVDKKGTMGTEIKIFVDGRENTKIHTSCSQPIGPGLVSGDFEVIEGYSREGGLLCPVDMPPPDDDCECEGKVTQLTLQYNGSVGANVVVEQKKDNIVIFDEFVNPGDQFTFVGVDKHGTMGTEIKIFVDGRENTKIHTSCSQPIGPGLVSGDFEVIEGYSREGGMLCPVDMPPGDDDDDDDCECDGKVTELTLQYNGSIGARVVVEQKKDNLVIFDEFVNPGDQFTFVGVDKHGTMGTEIKIYVGITMNTQIHTSCSQPIGPGLVSGDFEVIEGYSRNGGLLCPL